MTFPTFTKLGAAVYVNAVDVSKTDTRKWSLEVETALNALFSEQALINGKIVPSVAANSLTIAIKTAAGADPSATDPVYAVFRDAALTTGGFSVVAITAATSLVISAGSTLGAGTSPKMFVGVFNDGGTVRLTAAVLNVGAILTPISETGIASSTAEGGAGAADTAGVFYTGAAVSSKAFRIVGSLEWTTPLGVAGTYSAAPDVAKLWHYHPELINISSPGKALMQGVRGADLFKVLAANEAGADVSTAQPWFPSNGGVTVVADTTYFFEGLLRLSRAAGAVSHTTGLLFAGTATLTSIAYLAMAKEGDANDLQDASLFWAIAATELVMKAASTSTTEQSMFRVQGTVRINAAGTFIPQFKYSAAPGGAPSVLLGTHFRMTPVGNGSVASFGTWA